MTKKQKVKYVGNHRLKAFFYVFMAGFAYDVVQALYTIANIDPDRSVTNRAYPEFVNRAEEVLDDLDKPFVLFSGGKDVRDS